jgi:putative hemolysin
MKYSGSNQLPKPQTSADPNTMDNADTLIDLRKLLPKPYAPLGGPLSKVLGIDGINKIYGDAIGDFADRPFFRACLDSLEIDIDISDEDLERLNTPGPLAVVCNHPFGVVDALAVCDLLTTRRNDTKILANYLLENVPEISPHFIKVDPFDTGSSRGRNLGPMREALGWLKEGGCLVAFPAGAVAHWRPGRGIVDDPWSPHIAALVARTGASVLPIYIEGRNSLWFQAAGTLHPKIRTALLAREALNKRGGKIRLHVGKPIPWKRLEPLADHRARVDFMRMRTLVLRNRSRKNHPTEKVQPEPLSSATATRSKAASALQAEVDALPESSCTLRQGDYRFFVVPADAIPTVLPEIGRQREITFREVGEGTGKDADIDRFDRDYLHAFLWNDAASELVGAYRIGLADQLLAAHGKSGLYTHTLFKFSPEFLAHLSGGALELGRSFITSGYQRKHSSLALIWKGVLRWLADAAPHCKILFGPVSISQEYNAFSKNLIVQYLRRKLSHPEISAYVKPRHPFRTRKLFGLTDKDIAENLGGIEDINALVSEIEDDGKGVPVLIKHYLKMRATLISFNVDPDFSDVLDGLLLSDLTQVDPKLLGLYMGKERAAAYLEYHSTGKD